MRKSWEQDVFYKFAKDWLATFTDLLEAGGKCAIASIQVGMDLASHIDCPAGGGRYVCSCKVTLVVFFEMHVSQEELRSRLSSRALTLCPMYSGKLILNCFRFAHSAGAN